MSRSDALGSAHDVALQSGVIRYRDCGVGAAIVFVHGLLVNGDLWRKVVPPLAPDYRCITPDWPLGSHDLAMRPDADLRPPALARLIADFLAALDLEDVTLVANDTGGALAQIVVTEHPERVGRLVLTNCDAYENFLPPMFRYLQWSAHVPGAIFALTQTLRVRALRRLPNTFGWLAKRPIDDAAAESYVRPVLSNRAVRRDVIKVLRGVSPRYTLMAAEKLRGFPRPVLLAWAPDDRLFPSGYARQLCAAFPDARIDEVADSYTFVPEDQPAELAKRIRAFVCATDVTAPRLRPTAVGTN